MELGIHCEYSNGNMEQRRKSVSDVIFLAAFRPLSETGSHMGPFSLFFHKYFFLEKVLIMMRHRKRDEFVIFV
jgi:hypothetical protein